MSRILSVPKTLVWGAFLVLLAAAPIAAQDEQTSDQKPAPEAKFEAGLFATLGSETIEGVNYQYLGLLPDFSYGPWGVGLDLSFHFRFNRSPTDDFGFYPRPEDWWDSDLTTGQNVEKYLARLAYLRYGKKGDPLYAQIGWLPSTTLGTGFIVAGYNNGALRPAVKLTGLNLDASGSLFGVPWIGAESFIGNIATFDLLGMRAYAKPFVPFSPESQILKDLQVGFTAVADTNPYANQSALKGSGTAVVTGVDVIAPLYNSAVFTTRATLDVTAEGAHAGTSLGVDGTLVQVITWGFQTRLLGENFIPNYFDQGYEISRTSKYLIYKGDTEVPGTFGWQTALGTSLLGDAVQMGFILSGPFGSVSNVLAQPQLIGYANLKHGLTPVDFNAYYVKHGVTSFGKLANPEDALIGAKVGWTFGVVTLSIIYDLRYDAVGANGNPWVTSSRVETAVKLF